MVLIPGIILTHTGDGIMAGGIPTIHLIAGGWDILTITVIMADTGTITGTAAMITNITVMTTTPIMAPGNPVQATAVQVNLQEAETMPAET